MEQHISTALKFCPNSKYTKKIFEILKFSGGIWGIVQWNNLGIIRFQNSLTERVTIEGIFLVLKFRDEWNYP